MIIPYRNTERLSVQSNSKKKKEKKINKGALWFLIYLPCFMTCISKSDNMASTVFRKADAC